MTDKKRVRALSKLKRMVAITMIKNSVHKENDRPWKP